MHPCSRRCFGAVKVLFYSEQWAVAEVLLTELDKTCEYIPFDLLDIILHRNCNLYHLCKLELLTMILTQEKSLQSFLCISQQKSDGTRLLEHSNNRQAHQLPIILRINLMKDMLVMRKNNIWLGQMLIIWQFLVLNACCYPCGARIVGCISFAPLFVSIFNCMFSRLFTCNIWYYYHN